jgi:beta-glucosidase
MSGSAQRFPPGFIFGVATAAYQVEGGIENDWADWERANRLKKPNVFNGRSVDHWNRYEEDYLLAKAVGASAFRISLEWARIEPERGRFDHSAIDGYRERLLKMKAMGLSPIVTLHHFTHPRWFNRETPWHQPESIDAFRRYARVCADIVKGLDAMVLTFNEPMVLLLGGYLQGLIPPGITDGGLAMKAIGNIARSHVAAREEMLTHAGKLQIGTSQNMIAFAPDRAWNPLDRLASRWAAQAYNHAFLEALTTGELNIFMPGMAITHQKIEGGRDSIDFIGLNYYTRAHLRFIGSPPFVQQHYRDKHQRGLTHIGWEDYPEGFGQLLREVSRYRLPIWITENGIDDREGQRRPRYLYSHWQELLKAVDAGIDVRGYLHWSLLDNFEWLEGWGPRFGLYRVDFDTLERIRTPACEYFRQVATSGVLTAPAEPASPENPTLKASGA